jgi:hypothetical protein
VSVTHRYARAGRSTLKQDEKRRHEQHRKASRSDHAAEHANAEGSAGTLSAKNGILIVEQARELRNVHHKSILEAATEASRIRFRPILMTSFAFILGVLPLVLATGAGANAHCGHFAISKKRLYRCVFTISL